MQYLTVVPAYGRDYRSKAAVLADWNAGNDFRIVQAGHKEDGRYINKDDKPAGVTLQIRYAKLTKVTLVP
ncbi:MAG TPA: hypothetical protein VGG75_38625 [Trebonia sp.]|jgi:hypothetical protein